MQKFFQKNKYWILFSLILILAIIIRGYKLGQVPHGMTWDEAAIGYNGYAIFTTRRDEWLQKLPISFKSFGDYKAPFAIYLNGLFTFVFGMNLLAVRMPFFLAGIFAIAGMMLMTRELFSSKFQILSSKFNVLSSEGLSLLAGLLMTLSPWHIHFSRTGFESGMALSFIIWGVVSFLYYLDSKKKKFDYLWIVSSVMFFVLSIYTYHSAKLVAPLLALSLVVFCFSTVKKKIKPFLAGAGFALLCLYPFIKDSLFGNGAERLTQASFIREGMTASQIIGQFLDQYFAHFSLNYLIMGQTTNLRHGDGVWGVLFLTTLILVIVSIIISLWRKKLTKVLLLGCFWILIGILPAAIGEDVPHSNRAFLSFPGYLILAVYGADLALQLIKSTKINKKIKGSHGETGMVVKGVIGSFVILHLFFAITYLQHYFTVFASQSATDWKDGYLEAFTIARQYEKGLEGKPQVDQIVFTNQYGQSYIYALFVRKTNPIWYQGGSLNKYLLKNIDLGDFSRKNVLLVTSATDDFSDRRPDYMIMGSDDQIKFKIYYLPSAE